MSFTIKHIGKYMRWVNKEFAAYRETSKFSHALAQKNLRLDIALLWQSPQKKIDAAAKSKHDWILTYLRACCPETLKKYSTMKKKEVCIAPQKEAKVWSMWWQGEKEAAPLFKMCIASARKHTGHPVVVLSENNYTDYFSIPEYMLQKHKEGKIALQHICDFMVVSILASQGGFFTGATVYISQNVPENLLKAPFFTCRAATSAQTLMSRSRWVGYLLAGNKDFPLFSFARDFLMEYWKKNDRVVDYLLLDYIFELAYETIPCVKNAIDALPDNNLRRNELIERLGEPYCADGFAEFINGETIFYKLSWKFGNKALKTPEGAITNYGHMLQEFGLEEEA